MSEVSEQINVFCLFVCFPKPTTCDSLKYLWFKENLTQQSAFLIEVLKEGDAPGITSNCDCMHVHTQVQVREGTVCFKLLDFVGLQMGTQCMLSWFHQNSAIIVVRSFWC